MLGPGWIDAFETGTVVPTLDVFLALVQALEVTIHDVTANVPPVGALTRKLYASQHNTDLLLHFDYTDYKATYRLPQATLAEFEALLHQLRIDLAATATAQVGQDDASKTDAVATAFLSAVACWPTANPSDLWWFLIYRAFLDLFNHPATESQRDLGQSWKRTAGWALERVLVWHYRPWLAEHNVRLFVAEASEKQALIAQLARIIRGGLDSGTRGAWRVA